MNSKILPIIRNMTLCTMYLILPKKLLMEKFTTIGEVILSTLKVHSQVEMGFSMSIKL